MRVTLYWAVCLASMAYTGWIWAHAVGDWVALSGASGVEQANWIVSTGLGMILLWLVPMFGAGFLAWTLKRTEEQAGRPVGQPTVTRVSHVQPAPDPMEDDVPTPEAAPTPVPVRSLAETLRAIQDRQETDRVVPFRREGRERTLERPRKVSRD